MWLIRWTEGEIICGKSRRFSAMITAGTSCFALAVLVSRFEMELNACEFDLTTSLNDWEDIRKLIFRHVQNANNFLYSCLMLLMQIASRELLVLLSSIIVLTVSWCFSCMDVRRIIGGIAVNNFVYNSPMLLMEQCQENYWRYCTWFYEV